MAASLWLKRCIYSQLGVHAPILALPAPIAPCACGRLRRAARALTQLYDDAMAPSGLRVTQYSLLSVLAQNGPLRISDLAARQLLDRTALSRNLDPLVERGLVAVTAGRDARTREVAVTGKGANTPQRAEAYWKRGREDGGRGAGKPQLET